jgi:hypothetical protein
MATQSLSRQRGFRALLTPDGYNPKTKKGRARGYATAIMHLAPANLSGRNVCQFASPGCRAACLNTAGRGGILKHGETTNAIQLARIARTRLFFDDRPAFARLMASEIAAHVRRSRKHGLIPTVRLNGTSDIPWEKIRIFDRQTIFERFADVQFYDYTKSAARALAHARGEMPSNYALTFSRSESNGADVAAVLAAGGNVAAVFATGLPATYAGAMVIDGDQDDLRFLDPAPVVVGLKAKGKGRRDGSGFVVQPGRVVLTMVS